MALFNFLPGYPAASTVEAIAAPANFTINNTAASSSVVYGNSCILNWDTNSQAAIYYIIANGKNIAATSDTSYAFSNPSAYTSKSRIYIQAKTSEGIWSKNSSAGYFQYTELSNPINLQVNGSTTSTSPNCVLTWERPATIVPTALVTYDIYVDGVLAASTTDLTWTFSSATISSWLGERTITVRASTTYAASTESNSVTYSYALPSIDVLVAASKYATSSNSSFANTGGTKCNVGRSTKSSPVGTAMRFDEPSVGWSSYSSAVLHVQRNAGTASCTITIGKLNQTYATTIYCTQFYYGNYTTSMGQVTVGAATQWFSLDISSYIPTSGEWGITLTSTNAYCLVDGTTAYITLS